jgi:transposase-like protein
VGPLVLREGCLYVGPVAHVAAEIGVGEQALGRWVRLAREAASAGDTGAMLDADERAELERLRRETLNYVWTVSF